MQEGKKSFVVVTQSPLIYRQCLQSSTVGIHEYLKLELLGAGEPLVSLSIARSCATMVAQTSILDGDKSWNEKDEENNGEGRFIKWSNCS